MLLPYPREKDARCKRQATKKNRNGQNGPNGKHTHTHTAAGRREATRPRRGREPTRKHKKLNTREDADNARENTREKKYRKNPSKPKNLVHHEQQDEAIVQQECRKDTLRTNEPPGPSGTAGVSAVPAPVKRSSKTKETINQSSTTPLLVNRSCHPKGCHDDAPLPAKR